jgi:hypothetical protein
MRNSKWQLVPFAALGLALASTAATATPTTRTQVPAPRSYLSSGATKINAIPTANTSGNTFTNANTPKTGGATKTGAANSGATAVLTTLHQANKLLATADHDYDGHRAKAAHLIHEALRELGGHHQQQGMNKGAGANANNGQANKGAGAGANNNGNNGQANKIPQAQSDAQLQQAVQLLTGLQGKITNAKAAEHIQTAITELDTALKIK